MDKLNGQYLLIPDAFVEYRAKSQEKLTDKALILLYAFFYRAKYDREIIFTNNMIKNFLSDCANFTITRSLNLLKKFNYIDFSQKYRSVGNARKIVFTDKLLSFLKGGNFDINKDNATDLNNADASVDNSLNAHNANNDFVNDVDTDFNNDCAIDENHAILESGISHQIINDYSKTFDHDSTFYYTEYDNTFNNELMEAFEKRSFESAFLTPNTLKVKEDIRADLKDLKNNFPKNGFKNGEDLLEDLVKHCFTDFSLEIWRFKLNDQNSSYNTFSKNLAQHLRNEFQKRGGKGFIIDYINSFTQEALTNIKRSDISYNRFKSIVIQNYNENLDDLTLQARRTEDGLEYSTSKEIALKAPFIHSLLCVLGNSPKDAEFFFNSFSNNNQDFFKFGIVSYLLKAKKKNYLPFILHQDAFKSSQEFKDLINNKIINTKNTSSDATEYFKDVLNDVMTPITTKDNQILNFIN